MVRSGGSVCSAALRPFTGWALIHGSGETSMPNPPEEWWLDDALAKEMGLDIDAIEAENRRPRKQNLSLPSPGGLLRPAIQVHAANVQRPSAIWTGSSDIR
jgi:hypothetical protein